MSPLLLSPLPLFVGTLRRSSTTVCRQQRCLFHAYSQKVIPKRIIFGSCSDSSEDLTYWDTIRSLHPDLVILMGDNVYAGTSNKILKEEYQKLRNHPSFQRATINNNNEDGTSTTSTLPFQLVATLDDNDYDDTQKDESVRLFKEMFQPDIPETQTEGLYQAYEWGGNQLQVLLLDLRTCSDSTTSTTDDDDNNLLQLGDKQWMWLEEQLEKDFHQRIVVSSLQVLATGHDWDCWTNTMLFHNHDCNHLLRPRERLLQLLQGKNALLLSGDRHVSALYCCDDDDDNRKQHSDGHHHQSNERQNHHRQYEITCSSLTHSVPRGILDGEEDEHRISDFVYENNFGMLEFATGRSSNIVGATIRSTRQPGKILKQWHVLL